MLGSDQAKRIGQSCKTISGWSRNAVQVAQNTIGLLVVLRQNPIATDAGAPWVIKRRATEYCGYIQDRKQKSNVACSQISSRGVGFWASNEGATFTDKKVKIPLIQSIRMGSLNHQTENRVKGAIKCSML
jgi:hypothetical protein